jgi:hypothetical protein
MCKEQAAREVLPSYQRIETAGTRHTRQSSLLIVFCDLMTKPADPMTKPASDEVFQLSNRLATFQNGKVKKNSSLSGAFFLGKNK